jgi:hypothetical protein
MANPGDERFDYAGLTYDGNRALSIGTDPGRLDKAPSPGSSDLLDTSNGNVVKGGLPTYWTPSFSPDSKYVAYTNLDQGDGHLGVMNYDGSGFSGGRDVKVDNGKSLGWASFLPDSLGVVYHEGDRFSTAGTAELRLIQVNSSSEGTVNPLAALNGYLPDGTTSYLPYGIAEEGHRDYQPTVLPRPIGGYYWVIFPTRRAYGNTLAPGGTDGGGTSSAMERKKAWVAAIDIDHPSKADPSHPAFYLAGQSILADTNRPFVALPPCAPDGASCESGADCCSGFCRETSRAADGTPILQCVPAPPGACANLDEACVTAADCCDPTNLCIAGRCAIPTPVIF